MSLDVDNEGGGKIFGLLIVLNFCDASANTALRELLFFCKAGLFGVSCGVSRLTESSGTGMRWIVGLLKSLKYLETISLTGAGSNFLVARMLWEEGCGGVLGTNSFWGLATDCPASSWEEASRESGAYILMGLVASLGSLVKENARLFVVLAGCDLSTCDDSPCEDVGRESGT